VGIAGRADLRAGKRSMAAMYEALKRLETERSAITGRGEDRIRQLVVSSGLFNTSHGGYGG
jgi:hypothetical protein